MHVYSKNTSQNIYVCLGSKIPGICIYIAKIPHKIYICLGSKIPHEKKIENRKISCLAEKKNNMLLKRDNFQLFFENFFTDHNQFLKKDVYAPKG